MDFKTEVIKLHYKRPEWKLFPLLPKSKLPYLKEHNFLHGGCKDATNDAETLKDWWTSHPESNIGLALGGGIIAFDIDNPDGCPYWNDIKDVPTWVSKSGRDGNGYHYLFHCNNIKNISKSKDWSLRADGYYIVLPPSIHPDTGKAYQWFKDDCPIAELPKSVYDKLPKTKESVSKSDSTHEVPVDGKIPKGIRDNYLASIAGVNRKYNMGKEVSEFIVKGVRKYGLDELDTFPESQAIQKNDSIYNKYAPGELASMPCDLDLNTPIEEEKHNDKHHKPSIKQRALDILKDVCKFCHCGQYTYMTYDYGDYVRTYSINSAEFRDCIEYVLYKTMQNDMPSDTVIKSVISILNQYAKHDCDLKTVVTRSFVLDDVCYIDVHDEIGSVVRIDKDGWTVIKDKECPILFSANNNMLPLYMPQKGGNVDSLRDIINVSEDVDWSNLLAWIVCSITNGPFPLLVINGEAGSSKTTLSKILIKLLDNNTVEPMSKPENIGDMMVQAHNSRILAYDNLSGMSEEMSNAFCRISTGSSFPKRMLFTDHTLVNIKLNNPSIVNGISELIRKADFADRCIKITLNRLDGKTKPLNTVFKELDSSAPCILGALYDGVSVWLKNKDSIEKEYSGKMTRMVEFCIVGLCVEKQFGFEDGYFMGAYSSSIKDANSESLSGNSVILEFANWVTKYDSFDKTETASWFLNELNNNVEDSVKRDKYWPRNSQWFSRHLNASATSLREVYGISVTAKRHKKSRFFRVKMGDDKQKLCRTPIVTLSSPGDDISPQIEEKGDDIIAGDDRRTISKNYVVTPKEHVDNWGNESGNPMSDKEIPFKWDCA